LTAPVTVSVELYGIVRDLVKETKIELELPDSESPTFRDVLEGLSRRHGPALRDRLFDRYGPSSFVKVFAAGRPVTDLDQPLDAESGQAVRVIIFAAAGGG
jgi:hypothetical protein